MSNETKIINDINMTKLNHGLVGHDSTHSKTPHSNFNFYNSLVKYFMFIGELRNLHDLIGLESGDIECIE